MKYFFETYGCQMNTAESAALTLAAKERGWEQTDNADIADLILLNTCSVRETAEQRVRGRLAHYAALKKKREKASREAEHEGGEAQAPLFTLVMAGCMAERLGEKLTQEFPAVDYVMGTSARSRFPLILEAVEKAREQGNAAPEPLVETDEKPEFAFSSLHLEEQGEQTPFRSFVPIMHGCNHFCSYCIVPYVRGREISRSPESILEEIRLVGERGVREVTLLGQNVNSYLWKGSAGKKDLDFPGLLELVGSSLSSQNLHSPRNSPDGGKGVRWVRFLSSHPKDLSHEAIRVMAKYPVFCHHIHLCVQHGSDRILKAMNRQYTRSQYLDLVSRLRAAVPDLSLSTDILVGFPGETEKDFETILTLMDEVKFQYSYMYHYNPREGTPAYRLPDRISEEVKRQRLARVIALQKEHTAQLLKSRIGANVTALIEGISRKNADELIGRTERDEMVVVPGGTESIGCFANLTLSTLRGNTFRAPALQKLM